MGNHMTTDIAMERVLEKDTLISEEDRDLTKYEYPFENLILEGGGIKGIAYAGVSKVLMDVGMWPNFKRFGGTSVGAMIACLLAVDYSPCQVAQMMNEELIPISSDHSCGIFSFIPNLLRHYGWNPGKKLLEWFGEKLEAKTGNCDITFKELFCRYGKELCIVVCNVNQMNAEFCHVKTTPSMPIRLAVRMSMSIPGYYEAVTYDQDVYVDGGVLVNYPIHCYDGWWLSLKPEDCFLVRMQPLRQIHRLWKNKERFGEFNEKTLGILLCSEREPEVYEGVIFDNGLEQCARPDTTLARKRGDEEHAKDVTEAEHKLVSEAMSTFITALANCDLDKNCTIDKEELSDAINKSRDFTEDHAKTLFGVDCQIGEVFEQLDTDKNGKITFNELMRFAERRGIDLESQFVGYERKEISNIGEFLSLLRETVLVNLKRLYVTERDVDRTIAVDVDYLSALDFEMESEDKVFAIQRGVNAAKHFLKHYIKKNNPPIKEIETLPETN